MAPVAKGLGFAVVSVGLFLAFYYNVVVSWSIWYLLASLNPSLEWSRQVIRNSELLLSTTTLMHPFFSEICRQQKFSKCRHYCDTVLYLLWCRCGHQYNTDQCWSERDQEMCQTQGQVFHHNQCLQLEQVCGQWGLEGDF